MHLDRSSCVELATQIAVHLKDRDDVDCGLFPPAVYLRDVCEAVRGSRIRVGAQNVHDQVTGAFTGETSVDMAKDVGASTILVGHSERRHVFGESDAFIAAKVPAVLARGLEVVYCVGETIEERQADRTEEVIRRQVATGLEHVSPEDMARVTIAYEPVWAIGTGHTATPQQAHDVHVLTRALLGERFGDAVAQATRIQYGGSVKPGNATELMGDPEIDGALVGGASLKAADFQAILDAGR